MSTEVRVRYKDGDEFKALLISDLHLDNAKTKRGHLKEVLDEAKKSNAIILIMGDLFCLMQGKYDKRSNKNALLQAHKKDPYLDTVIEEGAEFLAPYAKHIAVISDGNHETAIRDRMETDPLERLCVILRDKHGSKVEHMPYMGFVRFSFEKEAGSCVRNSLLFFDHGHGGGIVTKGTQWAMRYSSMAPQADIVYAGHSHDRNMMETMRYIVQTNGQVKVAPQIYLKGGTFKEEFETGSGWAVEKLGMPKNIGSWWVGIKPKRIGVSVTFWPTQ